MFLVAITKRNHQIQNKSILKLFQEKISIRDSFPDGKDRRIINDALYKEIIKPDGNDCSRIQITSDELNEIADTYHNTSMLAFICKVKLQLNNIISTRQSNTPLVIRYDSNNHFIAGLSNVKQLLNESILWPRKHTELFRYYGIQSSDVGLLLFGPPGTGKTLVPRVMCSQLGCSLVNLKISEIIRGEIGSSEKNIMKVFTYAKRVAPSIIFIDEFQAIFSGNHENNGSGRSDSTLSATLALCFDELEVWNKYVGSESLVSIYSNDIFIISTCKFIR